ncbi:chitin deacetylase 8 [Folsomia candida]|uniref:NodB homology domain-containing protein n=1 Tax=Folsomia candida TaxID=158441 RepID=A0A226EA99_FOLCA|nr:chitin deacetylase 8 [Folsomia candida]OXA54064.1 hypothetical protein Fcan01_11196 [Folsomia candida]
MGQLIILMTLCAITFRVTHQFSQVDPKFVPALPCNLSACYLPDCRCSSDIPPGNLVGPNIPQMLLFTFDGAITSTNHPFFDQVFNDRRNPNGAPISVTFFVTHEFTNYSLVHDLWASGHDIAAHSITYNRNMAYWRTLSESGWRSEIVDQRDQISRFGSLPTSYIKGMRAPYLQMGGNTMFTAMSGSFEWESSRPTFNQRVPGLWPYTNDYASTQDCLIPPCHNDSFPGFWSFPMINFLSEDLTPCNVLEECVPIPRTMAGMYNLLLTNFNDQYQRTRAPLVISTHAAWFLGPPDRPEYAQRMSGLMQFLDYLGALSDVYVIGISQARAWMQTPTGMPDIDTFVPWREDTNRVRSCVFPRNCRYSNGTWERIMSSCIPCPLYYPTLHDPLGIGARYFGNDEGQLIGLID